MADNTAAPRFDAVYLLALAMQAADSIDADEIKQNLQAVSRADADERSVFADEWKQAKAELLAGRDVNYE